MSDKLTQNEIQELEGTLANNQKNDTSYIKDLLDKIPDGIFGTDEKKKMDEVQENATAAQMQQTQISPRDPEEQTLYATSVAEWAAASTAKAVEHVQRPDLARICQ